MVITWFRSSKSKGEVATTKFFFFFINFLYHTQTHKNEEEKRQKKISNKSENKNRLFLWWFFWFFDFEHIYFFLPLPNLKLVFLPPYLSKHAPAPPPPCADCIESFMPIMLARALLLLLSLFE